MAEIGYRMTIFDGPLYYTGSTILTPASGAPHSNEFKVTTLASETGYYPYMRIPRGQSAEFDIRGSRSTVGKYTVEVLDKRLGEDNDERWVTAFIGDENNKLNLLGKKVFIEETVDSGVNWTPFFIGGIDSVELTSKLTYTFELGDSLELMKQTVFDAAPTVDYAVYSSLLPIGLTQDLQLAGESTRIPAVSGLDVERIVRLGNTLFLTLTNAAKNRLDNIWIYGSTGNVNRFAVDAAAIGYRCQVLKDGQYYHYLPIKLQSPANSSKREVKVISHIYLAELPITDPLYSPLSEIGVNDDIKVWLYQLQDNVSEKYTPFWLNETPYNILEDLLKGQFYKNTPNKLVIPYNSASISALKTSNPLPTLLYKITEKTETAEFIEKHILKPYSLGYTFEPMLINNVPQSAFTLFSTKLPTSSLGLQTITSDNVIANSAVAWKANKPVLSVQGTYYVESKQNIDRDRISSLQNNVEAAVTLENKFKAIVPITETEDVDASDKQLTVDFNGLRGVNNDVNNIRQDGLINNVDVITYVDLKARLFLYDIFLRNMSGNPSVQLQCLRSGSITTVKTGDFVLVEDDVLPNQAIYKRGGTRLFQVTQKNNVGQVIDFVLHDSGVNETMATASFGTIAASLDSASVQLTTTELADVQLQYAVVDLGASVPAANSDNWMLYTSELIDTTTETILVYGLPSNSTVYFRARATSVPSQDLKLPSPFVTSAALNTPALAPPTNVTVSNITSRSARVSWTNSNTDRFVQVWLASPSSSIPNTLIAELPNGSNVFTLLGLNKNTDPTHKVGVKYVDNFRGTSVFASASFTAAGATTQLDAPAAIIFYVGTQ